MRKVLVVVAVALACLAFVSASSGRDRAPTCPAQWAAGWQRLADRIQAPIYCPTWMPNPLDARIGGDLQDIYSVDRDRSYLVSFLYHGDLGTGDVHVNFRGYPGRTAIPRCTTVLSVEGGKPVRGTTPCFDNPSGSMKLAGRNVTIYTVNRDADQWHVLLAWRHGHSLYAVSEHVSPPYTYKQVVANLNRLLGSLVLIQPRR